MIIAVEIILHVLKKIAKQPIPSRPILSNPNHASFTKNYKSLISQSVGGGRIYRDALAI